MENRDGRRFCAKCGAPLTLACGACGFANEPGEDFCGGCGAPLAVASSTPEPMPSAPVPRFTSPETYTPQHLAERIMSSRGTLEGERKQVTVLFADLKGSMELLADRDPANSGHWIASVAWCRMWCGMARPNAGSVHAPR